MPAITINVSDFTFDILTERAAELGTGWTATVLAAELVDDTFEDPAATAQYFTSEFGFPSPLAVDEPNPCSGPCKGHGVGKTWKSGACPDPCDATTMAALDKEARKNARLNAIADCMAHGENCICSGGTYTKGTDGCKTHDRPDGTKYCKFRVSYDYVGTCGTLA